MAGNRISILVALDGSDEGLRRALSSAEKSLGELASSAKTAGAKASAGVAEVKAGFEAFGEQVNRAKGQLLAFLTIGWAAGKVQEIVQVADAWNQMTARLKLATAGQREFATAQKELFEIAQRIGVPIQETATLYGKLQQAVRMLGGDQQQALSLTESISQALRISGASATEAQSSLLQFGQALASGALRGDEFNSVVENSPRLAQALADGLNVPIGRLRKLAEEGRLTADVVVQALLSQKDKLAAEYAQLPQTVSQSFTRLSNAFGQWIGKLDESTGFTRKLAEALTWLAQNLDTVMQWLKRIAEVGLAVLIYRLIPAFITAWQTAGAAAIAAANATVAAWTTANQSVSAAVASVGVLRTAFSVLSAFLVGWEIGTWLSEKFEIVRKAGIFLVETLMKGFEQLRYGWEVFAALFTADTLAAATQRHQARLAEMNRIFAEMYADAGKGSEVAKGAMNTAATAAEEIGKRLEAIRQGTQEAVGRGVEAIHAVVEKLQSRIGEVEQAIGKANQTVNDATAKMAAAYQGLTTLVEAELQQQIEAVKARYSQEQSALETSKQSEAALITKSTQLLTEALTQQTGLRRQAMTESLQLIDEESTARIEAASRQGRTEAERSANVQRVENEILATKRQTLAIAVAEYRQHIDALNAEANRHLAEIQRIEAEKRQLSMTTEERIREILRAEMSDYEATEDRKRQVVEYQVKAREALAQGEFEQARSLAQKAMDLAAQVAGTETSEAKRAEEARRQSEQGLSEVTRLEAQSREASRRQEYDRANDLMREADQLRSELSRKTREADTQIAQGKDGVNQAILRIRDSEDILNQTLDAEASAHRKAAQSALSARDEIQRTLGETARQIDEITTQLQEGLKVTLEADTTRFDQAIDELDKALAEKQRLLVIQADLQQAERMLRDYEEKLKAGQTLPVDADVSKAQEALTRLKAYADETSQIDLKVSTEQAQTAITQVQNQIEALNRLETESQHSIRTNADDARAEVLSLDGLDTSSTHTIHVRKVEENAAGGLVGLGIPQFAKGGAVVPAFPRMHEGTVPGSGNRDTVPRTLEAGAFVLRRAAVRKYGSGELSRLANGVARFAKGGLAMSSNGGSTENPSGARKKNRQVAEALKMIDLGMQGALEYSDWLERNYAGSVSLSLHTDTILNYSEWADQDRRVLHGWLHLKQLTDNESDSLDRITDKWRQAMVQPLLWGEDLQRQLNDYLDEHEAEFYRKGGIARSDSVPALLTPGEFVVNKAAVARFGVGFFEALNQLALPAQALAQRVRGYARGGFVSPLTRFANQASHGVKSLPSPDLGALLLTSIAQSLQGPSLSYATEVAPSRTLRVELASGSRSVATTMDARDEAKLLDLLKAAQARAL